MLKIVGVDNLARETVADKFLIGFPEDEREMAQAFCDWLNKFSCDETGGFFYQIKDLDYQLSRGMEDFV